MKISFLSVCLLFIAGFVNARDAPAAVKEAFAKVFPGAHAKWGKENKDYEANFKNDGKEMSAVFTADGTLKETETTITIGELPSGVTDYIAKQYNNAAIKEAAKITKADGTVNYETELNHKDVIFDAIGKFVKEAKD